MREHVYVHVRVRVRVVCAYVCVYMQTVFVYVYCTHTSKCTCQCMCMRACRVLAREGIGVRVHVRAHVRLRVCGLVCVRVCVRERAHAVFLFFASHNCCIMVKSATIIGHDIISLQTSVSWAYTFLLEQEDQKFAKIGCSGVCAQNGVFFATIEIRNIVKVP